MESLNGLGFRTSFVMIQMYNEIRIVYTLLILFRSKIIQRGNKWLGIDFDAIWTKLPNKKVFERPRYRCHYNLFLWIYISSVKVFDSFVFE